MDEACAGSPFACDPGASSIPERPAITQHSAYTKADASDAKLITGGTR